MPNKIPATKKQTSLWVLHFLVFIVINAGLWYICYAGKEGWQYPWPAWITAAWFLLLVGHACMIWANYEDEGMQEWKEQAS